MKDLFEIRKELHRIPEHAFEEFETTEYLVNKIEKLPLVKIHRFPFTGLLVEYSQGNGKYQMFRAELDALPIKEQTNSEFASKNKGYMHACGHDIHMTVLVGLIKRVVKEKLNSNLLFLFQPAEEGFGGAEKVLANGILNRFDIAETFALHVHPNYPTNTIACKPGIIFGIPQEFDIAFQGKSAHAANPHKGNDTIAAAIDFSNNIYKLLAKSLPPTEHYICHIGKINGGSARNIVADKTTIEGTLRGFNKITMQKIKNIVVEIATIAAKTFGVDANVNFLTTYDPVINDPILYAKLKQRTPSHINLVDIEPALTGEDFGFFTSKYRGLLFWLGAGEIEADLHSPKFIADENSIPTGIDVFFSLIDKDDHNREYDSASIKTS